MTKTNNTICGRHINLVRGEDISYQLGTKDYFWHIPKNMRHLNIQKGDCVLAQSGKRIVPIYVCNSFRDEFEITGNKYRFVKRKIDWNKEPINID